MDLVSFIAEDAINYSIEEAILLWHIKKTAKKNFYDGKNIHEDEVWIPMDLWELKFSFPFWSQGRISKLLASLVRKQVVKKKRVYELRREFSYALANERDLV
jgi:hypothetical protein